MQAGDRRPALQVRFEDYYERWIDTYAGRTERGFTETTRSEYRRLIERHVLDRWRAWKLGEIEPPDVRALFADLRADGVRRADAAQAAHRPLGAVRHRRRGRVVRSNPIPGCASRRRPTGGATSVRQARR